VNLHVGIIMDGNGRWAQARGWPRVAGHRVGTRAVRRVLRAAPGLGIGTLTMYAFSADNWRRPPDEVQALMRLFRTYLRGETREMVANGIRLNVIGRRDRLHPTVLRAVDDAEYATAEGDRLLLRLAVDYSARDAIVQAASWVARDAREGGGDEPLTRERFSAYLADAMGAESATDLDLLVRTGGEQRVSDFLLWEAAYAELYFFPKMWPDFDGDDLATAVAEFHRRQRRFGALPEAVPVAPAITLPGTEVRPSY
jgi:undecaprenyl diphosphate synthase